jgi:hypothetical protein
MRAHKLVVSAAVLFGAATCTDSVEHTIGMRLDGVKVDCVERSDDVSACAAVDDPCDAQVVLWPPNHKMERFTLADCAPAPSCDGGGDGGGDGSGSGSGSGSGDIIFRTDSPLAAAPADARITSITADEDVDVGAGGDGHTTDTDMAIVDDVTFDLRSERQGGSDGRVYRVNFVDGAGVTGSCDFVVPHNQGPTSGALDSGTVVTLTR